MNGGAPGGDAGQGQPGAAQDADGRARQMRALPAEQLVAEVLLGLLNAAQIKLGRRDARLLIDLGAVLLGHARPYLSGEFTAQIDQLLGQLRLGQVSAEAQAGQPEENDLDRVPAPPPAGAPPSQAAG